MNGPITVPEVDLDGLRCEIQLEYGDVASKPDRGYHFHTGRKLATILEYHDDWLDGVPERAIESFAGTGNPFAMGVLRAGAKVVDLGCGAGLDALIAATMVGVEGRVVGVDMTSAMLDKARAAADERGFANVEFREGYAERLPVDDGWADVVISNGAINLCPDKLQVFREIHRVLKPGGRIQIGDIQVAKAVPDPDKRNIDLWKG